MAVTTGPQIDLNQIHVEAGGGSGTQCSQGDTDIRGLIKKAASTQSAMTEWYGATASASFVGAVTQSLYAFDDVTSLSFNLSGIVQVGDLVVIAIESRDDYAPGGTSFTGGFTAPSYETFTDNTRKHNPGWGFWAGPFASGNSTTIGVAQAPTYHAGKYIHAVCAVYRDVATYRNSAQSILNLGLPNPPAIGAAGDTKLIIVAGYLDDDGVAMTPPSGFTLAGNAYEFSGSCAIAHLITDSDAAIDPGAFGGTGNDGNVAITARFGS